jgi:tRNA (adenine57-N1/adenine58-N1)-methyltransferase
MAKSDTTVAKAGDLVQLVGLSHKNHITRLVSGKKLQTHRGVIEHDNLIGLPWGSRVRSHLGRPFHLLEPSLADIIQEVRRRTQIVYPKDIGYILVKMGIGPGSHVLEAGTGSGGLTIALAFATGKEGRVFSYEIQPENLDLAKKNLRELGMDHNVTFKLRDIADGFDEREIDAVFLDLQNPHKYLAQVKLALKAGGYFGSILPNTNQVYILLKELQAQSFAYLEVSEILLRYYRADPARLRPVDRMVAHTGYLIFGRKISFPDPTNG